MKRALTWQERQKLNPREREALAREEARDELARYADVVSAIDARWGVGAGEDAFTAMMLDGGVMSAQLVTRGSMAYVAVHRPRTGQNAAWFVRHEGERPSPSAADIRRPGSSSSARFACLDGVSALGAVLADGQPDVVKEHREILSVFGDVAFAQLILDEAAVEQHLRAGSFKPASEDAITRFEPPHFEGRAFVFVANIPWEARLVRISVDADTLGVRSEELGRGAFIPAPIGRALVDDTGALAFPALVPAVTAVAARPVAKSGVARSGVARAAAAHRWREAARSEAASAPSFVRWAHELAAVGAPAALVARAVSAADDEREHARLSLAVAAHLDHHGAWSLEALAVPASRRASRARLAVDTLLEAAIPETLAAAEAERALLLCVDDDVIRAALTRIARDEQAHAALAWDAIAWALSERVESLEALEAVRAAVSGLAPPAIEGGALQDGDGQLSLKERQLSAAVTWAGVVVPRLNALLRGSMESGADGRLAAPEGEPRA